MAVPSASPAPYIAPLSKDGATVTNPASLAGLRALMGGIAGGSGVAGSRAKFVMCGDSTMAGVGVGLSGNANAVGARSRAWPAQLAKLLPLQGIPAQINSVMGDSNMTQFVPYPQYDPRVTLGAGFVSNNIGGPGGYAFTYTGANSATFNSVSSTLGFTPENPIDSFEVIWRQRGGSVTVNVDGGAALTVSSGLGAGGTTISIPSSYASFGNGRSVFTGLTKGTHKINVVVQSGTTTDIVGIHAWDSTSAYLDIIPVCASGATIATFDDGSYFGGMAYLPYWMPIDFCLLNLSVNDTGNGTSAASYTASLADIKTKFASTSFYALGYAIGPYIGAMGTSVPGSVIGGAILAYAASLNQPVFDYASRWINGNSGLSGGDGVHPTLNGATDIARTMARMLGSL